MTYRIKDNMSMLAPKPREGFSIFWDAGGRFACNMEASIFLLKNMRSMGFIFMYLRKCNSRPCILHIARLRLPGATVHFGWEAGHSAPLHIGTACHFRQSLRENASFIGSNQDSTSITDSGTCLIPALLRAARLPTSGKS